MKLLDVTQHERYTNADMEICQYLRHHIKVICKRFHIVAPSTVKTCTLKMFEIIVEKHSETMQYVEK